jgi:predicted nucleotidyltransferase
VIVAALVVDLDRIAEICRRYGVARLELFGSVSRGDHRSDSDVDVLYELVQRARLGWAIEELSDELGEEFGRHVDLISRRALHTRLRDAVLADARLLYAA